MRELVLDAPWIQVAPAVALMVMAAALLYRIDRGNRHIRGGIRALLGVLRAAVLAILVMLLFRPVLRSEERTTTQPALLILQDASRSIGQDAPNWGSALDEWMASLPSAEGEPGARTASYGFGSELFPWAEGDTAMKAPVTDLASALDALEGQWAGRPVGAVVVATDGRFNRGRDPETVGFRFGAPVHFIRLGDTTLQKDVRIDRLLHNDIAGLGNRFPIEVEIGSQGVTGPARVTLTGPDTRLVETVTLEPGGAPAVTTFLVEAARPGIQRYTVQVADAEGETNLDNNRRVVTVDVIERKKRILLTGTAPHPDRGAWSNALSANANYEVVQFTVADLVGGDLDQGPWDGLLFFGFDPGDRDTRDLFETARENGWPLGLVIDAEADFSALAGLGIGVDVQPTRAGLTTDPRGSVNPAFPHFQPDAGLETMLAEVPPLVTPFGETAWGAAHTPLLFQRIGGIITDDPLLTVAQTNRGRLMVLLGEGSWRWRQVGYLRTGSHAVFDDLIAKLAQYLTSDPGVDRFRVEAPRLLDEDRRVTFEARVYDATLQPLAGADISLTLRDSTGTSYDYRFSSTPSGGYGLDAGRLPKGTYRWTARTAIAGQDYDRSGTFEIRGIQLELNGRPADHDKLLRMADNAGGQCFGPENLAALTETLSASDRFIPELSLSERLQDLIGLKALLMALVALLGLEWFVRRWSGTY